MAGQSDNVEALGDVEYRLGARQRLDEAFDLLQLEHFAGSIYLAGRSVEGMLRALIWKTDSELRQGKKSLQTGHDLRELLTVVRKLGLLQSGGRDDEFERTVQLVARLWFNNMRFASSRFVERRLRRLGEVGGKRTIKQASARFYEACATIIKRCEALWQR
jgi:hypothetical protein